MENPRRGGFLGESTEYLGCLSWMGSIGNREGANVDSVVGESSVSPNTVSKATKSLKNADTNLYRIIGAGEHMSVIPAL